MTSEHQLQAAIVEACAWRANQDARYALLTAIPNGQYRRGQRMEPGLSAGLPDLILFVAAHGYNALLMELKVGKNDLTPAQGAWITRLQEQGYFVAVVRDSVEDAMRILHWYLGEP